MEIEGGDSPAHGPEQIRLASQFDEQVDFRMGLEHFLIVFMPDCTQGIDPGEKILAKMRGGASDQVQSRKKIL